MKWDMGGAAVTVSIIKYLSEIKTNFSYAGIVGLVEICLVVQLTNQEI